MGILKFYAAIFTIVILASLVMISVKRFRRTGLLVLIFIFITLVVAGIRIYSPKKYERNYLKNSADWKSLSFRKYADSIGFYIGATPGGIDIGDSRFCDNFNSLTPENALKMGPLLNNFRIGEYDFSRADKLVDEAISKGLRVRGHTLVWGKQSDMFKSPDLRVWLKNYPEPERSRILKQTIENHILTVLNHFKGRIHIWDCVNEPMSMFRQGKIEDNVYSKYLGLDYIKWSFELAHSVDPSLKLYLNENFISYTDKTADAFIELVRKLKEKNVPVNGVGIQSHIGSRRDTSLADLGNFMKRITDMGLEVEITELDIRLRIFDAADDPYDAQAKYYARLLQTCLSNPHCKGVTFWGTSDNWCWLDNMGIFFPKPNEPYLFDAEFNPKPAFYEVYKTLEKSVGLTTFRR